MSFIKLVFRPGINRDVTNYSNEGGWYACDKVRFNTGMPQKIGGWQKISAVSIIGFCRQFWAWTTTYADSFLAAGTNAKVYIEVGANFYNVTPYRTVLTSPATNNCIYTTVDLAVVTVNLGAGVHGASTGDYVQISGVSGTDIGGIPVSEINANVRINVINANVFTFSVNSTATSTVSASGGTSIVLSFEVSVGNAAVTYGYGWGTGTWGRNGWNTGSSSPIALPQRDWWFDNFDNDLIMNIRNGAPYVWERGVIANPDTALNTRAITLQTYATTAGYDPNAVPVKVMQLLMSQQDRHLIAFGAVPFGSTNEDDFDPLLIRWADQDTPSNWTPSVTNSAGSIRVSRGSSIIRALPTRQEILVWTSSNLFTLQFLGTTDVFGLQEYASNISIIGPRAVCIASGNVYWMGVDKFYSYTGRVQTLNSTLRDEVFDNFNYAQADQVICGTNEKWNEVWWFYPTTDAEFNDAYVVYNYKENIWFYGALARTAWLDSGERQYPIGSISDAGTGIGYVYKHEVTTDADGSPIEAYIESSDFDLGDGDNFMLTRRVIPDVNFTGSTASAPEVNVQLRPRNFPGAASFPDTADTQPVVQGAVGEYTAQVFVRARARQMAIKVSSDSLGTAWQLGQFRVDARPDGRR